MKKVQQDIASLLNLHTDEPVPGLEPLQVWEGPLLPDPRPSPHPQGCWCVRCWQSGLDYADYLKAKKSQEI